MLPAPQRWLRSDENKTFPASVPLTVGLLRGLDHWQWRALQRG